MAKKESIDIKPSHKGALHRALGIPQGQTLTDEEIQQGLDSKDPAVRMMARFAKNAKGFSHGGAK
jgi:hypothetical protein